MHVNIGSCRNLGNLNTPYDKITRSVFEDGSIYYKLESSIKSKIGLPINVDFGRNSISCSIGSKKHKAKLIDSLPLVHPLIAIYNIKKLFTNNTSNNFLPSFTTDVKIKIEEHNLSLDITKYVREEDVDENKDYDLYPNYVDCSSEIYSMGKIKGSDVVENTYNIKCSLLLK